MKKYRSYSIEFKRQVSQEFLAGEPLGVVSKRHAVNGHLIRTWVTKYESGALDDDVSASDLITRYQGRIASLEQLVGKQALELAFLKGAFGNEPRAKSEPTSVIVGPRDFPSRRDAD
jgi:transposase